MKVILRAPQVILELHPTRECGKTAERNGQHDEVTKEQPCDEEKTTHGKGADEILLLVLLQCGQDKIRDEVEDERKRDGDSAVKRDLHRDCEWSERAQRNELDGKARLLQRNGQDLDDVVRGSKARHHAKHQSGDAPDEHPAKIFEVLEKSLYRAAFLFLGIRNGL